MKITHIEPMLIERPYEHGAPKPMLGAGAVRTMMDAVYIRVDTDAGVTGWGEAFGFGACRIALEAAKIVVAAARNAVGPDVALMLDTNCSWTPDEAIEMARRMQDHDLYWLEEPVSPPDDFDGLARVRRDGGIPVAAGENLGTVNDLRRIVEAGAVDVVQPDVTKIGGITEIWKAIGFAADRGARLEPHSPLFGPGLGVDIDVTVIERCRTG